MKLYVKHWILAVDKMNNNNKPILSVRNLEVAFGLAPEPLSSIIHDVSFDIHEGEIVGIIWPCGQPG